MLSSYSTEDSPPILCSISLDNFHGINIVSENICLQSIVLEKGFAVVVHGWMDTYEETKYYIDRIRTFNADPNTGYTFHQF